MLNCLDKKERIKSPCGFAGIEAPGCSFSINKFIPDFCVKQPNKRESKCITLVVQ